MLFTATTMRSQLRLFAFALLLSCAVSSARAQNCLTTNDTSTTLLPIMTADVTFVSSLFLDPTGAQNGSAGPQVWEKWTYQSMALCLANLKLTPTFNVSYAEIGAALVSIVTDCSESTTSFLGGFYPLTKPAQYGGLVYVLSSNVTNCYPPYN